MNKAREMLTDMKLIILSKAKSNEDFMLLDYIDRLLKTYTFVPTQRIINSLRFRTVPDENIPDITLRTCELKLENFKSFDISSLRDYEVINIIDIQLKDELIYYLERDEV